MITIGDVHKPTSPSVYTVATGGSTETRPVLQRTDYCLWDAVQDTEWASDCSSAAFSHIRVLSTDRGRATSCVCSIIRSMVVNQCFSDFDVILAILRNSGRLLARNLPGCTLLIPHIHAAARKILQTSAVNASATSIDRKEAATLLCSTLCIPVALPGLTFSLLV